MRPLSNAVSDRIDEVLIEQIPQINRSTIGFIGWNKCQKWPHWVSKTRHQLENSKYLVVSKPKPDEKKAMSQRDRFQLLDDGTVAQIHRVIVLIGYHQPRPVCSHGRVPVKMPNDPASAAGQLSHLV